MKAAEYETWSAQDIQAEWDGFEKLIQNDIRFLVLQDNIASLSKRVLTPEGKRSYDYCVEERDKLRLIGLRRGIGFVVD